MLREEKRERKEVRITVPGKFTGKPFISTLKVFFYIITRPEILISIGQQDTHTHTPKNESIFQKTVYQHYPLYHFPLSLTNPEKSA